MEKDSNENLRSIWFTSGTFQMGGQLIGIVLNTKDQKCYIGMGEGKNQVEDEKRICKTGAKFPVHIAEQLF